MKHKLWVTSLTILSACTSMACSHTHKKDTAASSTKESSSKVEKANKQFFVKRILLLQRKTSLSQETKGLEMQIMVTLIFQSKWIKFTDIDGTEAVQYTDGSGYNIVTLNSFTREKAKVPADIEFNAEFLAKKLGCNVAR